MKRSAMSVISWVALLTLIAKGLGMVRDILQARAFGTTANVDMFTAASNCTVFLFTTAAYALCLAAVPILVVCMRQVCWAPDSTYWSFLFLPA